MIVRLKRLWNGHPILLASLIVALAVFFFFGARTISEARFWNDPAHQGQELRGWMTPRYVSHSYRIPRDVLFPALGLDPVENGERLNDRITLDSIAASKGISLEDLEQQIKNLAYEMRERQKDQDDD